jgi:hypothetical protein
MAPLGNPSLFMRFFGLAENQPLYVMVGIACGLAVYTPIRHLTNAADIALDTRARAYGDNLAENPRYAEKGKHYYDACGPTYKVAKVMDGEVRLPGMPKVPERPVVGDGKNFPNRWQPRIPSAATLGMEPVVYPH